jgi:glycosyltransferase involved in cell wall biosynthesis
MTEVSRPRGVKSAPVETIDVCHVLGSVGHGGRESLLEELIRQSPDDIGYTVCGLRAQDGHSDRFEHLGTETVSFGATSTRDVRAVGRMARFLFDRSFDVIHAHGPNAQVPSRVLGRICHGGTIVSTVHGVERMFSERQLRLERLTRSLETRTIAVSNGVKQSYAGTGPPPDWETIHNGIDVESFNEAVERADPSDVVAEHSVSETDLVLLNVGRYVPPKSQLDLVDAMDRVTDERTDVRLFIVGGRGAMEGRLRDRVAEYGLEGTVTVTGRVEEIHPYYALADAFVSSSVGEGLPIVQLEAMAAELPVIATDIPGVRELVVDGETGTLVPTNDPAALSRAILDLADGDDRDRYGRAGFDRVRREFHIEKTVSEYVSLYRQLANGGTDG